MKMRLATFLGLCVLAVSCSTTKVLQEGEYRLAHNNVRILNQDSENPVDATELSQYIKQQPNTYIVMGWSPSLIIYNWSSKDGNKGKLWRRLGTAPVVYDYSLVDASVTNIEKHLAYKGYYNSTVESNVYVSGRTVTVSYDVTLGERYRIDSLVVILPEGRPEFKRDFMADHTQNCGVKVGDYIAEETLEAETVRSSGVLAEAGYYTLSKNNYVFEADTNAIPGKLILEMKVNEYSRFEAESAARPLQIFHFGHVTVTKPKDFKFRESVLREFNTIHKGNQFSPSSVNETYNRLASLKSFNSVSVELNGIDSTSTVDCNIKLTPAKLQGFKANLEVSTNSSGLFGISPQLTFFDRNVFNGGEWLNVSLMGNRQFTFDESGASANELGASATLSFPNFFGIANRRFKHGTVPRTEFGLSFNYQNRPEYTRSMTSFSLAYIGNIERKFNYQLVPFQLNQVRLYDIDDSFAASLARNPFMEYAYRSHYDQGVGAMLYYTTNPSSNLSKTYSYIRANFDLSGNFLSLFKKAMQYENGAYVIGGMPYSQYVKAEFNLGRTLKFEHTALATRLVAGLGYAYGNSSSLPFEKQFYVGGANSMRGWQSRALGPGASQKNETFSIPSQTGDLKFEADLEYRFNLFWKLEGAVFAEAGNVWNYSSEASITPEAEFNFKTLNETIAADWGYGLRVNLDFMILRLDLGHKLYEPSRTDSKWIPASQWFKSNGFAVHFGVGYPF